MTLPPFMLALAILFWGWETGFLVVAAIGAVIVELPRWVHWRWDFSATDMNRVWDLCGVLFLGAGVYAYSSSDLVLGPLKFLTWVPMVFFPFVIATAFSAQDNVTRSTYFLMVRMKKPFPGSLSPLGRYVPHWFLAVCIGSASVANMRDIRFYAGVVIFGAWLLWLSRNRSVPVWEWAIVIGCVSILGFAGHLGLSHLQAVIENRASQFFTDLGETSYDQIRTAIGSVGKLQQSGRIVLRVQTPDRQPFLEHLRSASFDTYQSVGRRSSWSASEPKYDKIETTIFDTWEFSTTTQLTDTATISMFLPRGTGILPSPHGPTVITGLFPGSVQTNRYGSINVRNGYLLAHYGVRYANTSTLDAPPTANDLVVPEAEMPAVVQVAGELSLVGRPRAEIVRRVETFFASKFTYTTFLKDARFDPTGRNTPLSQFLLRDHAGHCEYFATATTLLLRQAGIPARYAIGFSIPPEENHDHIHIVRALHAHAWTLAYLNGAWRDIDTTPGSWEGIEEAGESAFQPVNDFFGGLWYQFSYWRAYGERGTLAKRALWLLPFILLWLLWRIFKKKRQVRAQQQLPRDERGLIFGLDSEFYQIESHLAKAGIPRRPGESLHEWLQRLETACQPQWSIPALRDIIALHYTYRFDPQGLPADRRSELKSKADTWLGNASRAK